MRLEKPSGRIFLQGRTILRLVTASLVLGADVNLRHPGSSFKPDASFTADGRGWGGNCHGCQLPPVFNVHP